MTFALEWEIGSCLYSGEDDDGYPTAQFDADAVKRSQESDGFEPVQLHHSFGFQGRPRDPGLDADGRNIGAESCSLLYATEGDTVHAWLLSDPRYIPNLPKLTKGGSQQYGGDPERPTWLNIDGDDGTLTQYIPVSESKAHVITAGKDANGKDHITVAHADGMSVMMIDHKVVIRSDTGGAYVELNGGNVVISGNLRVNGGIVMGSPAAVPMTKAPVLITQLSAILTALDASFNACTPPQPPKFAAMIAALTGLATSITKAD